jgi:hypothetical protein
LCTIVATTSVFAADSTTTTRPNQSAALKGYQRCMKAHGVKLKLPTGGGPPGNGAAPPSGFTPPTGGTGGGNGNFPGGGLANLKPKGVSTKKWNAAQKACADELPSFANGGQNSQDFQAYLSCLSDHGVKVPSNGGIQNLDPNDETFKAANQTCGALLPQGVAPGSNPSDSAST